MINITINKEFYPFKESKFEDGLNIDEYYLYTEAYYMGDKESNYHLKVETYSSGKDFYIIPTRLNRYRLNRYFIEKDTLRYSYFYTIDLDVYL